MARLGRRFPASSELRKPTVVGDPVVYRPLKVALTYQYLPVQHVTDRAQHSRLRPPAAVDSPTVFRPLKVTLSGLQLPPQILTRRGTTYRLQAPTIIDVPGAPFIASAVRVRSVALFVQQAAAGQRRAPTSKLSPPTIVDPPIVFRPLDTTTVRQPRRFQHVVYRLQPPVVVDPFVTPTIPFPVNVMLAPRPAALRRRTRYRLLAPTVVDPFVPPSVSGLRLRTLMGVGQ